MTTVSTRPLKDKLSAFLRRAEKGEQIIVMRGKRVVAALVPFDEASGVDEETRLRQLAAQDLLVLPKAGRRPGRFAGPRVPDRGKPAAEMVLEDRR